MPIQLERKLKATAKKRHYGKARTGAFVYGTITNIEKGKKRKKGKGSVTRGSKYNVG